MKIFQIVNGSIHLKLHQVGDFYIFASPGIETVNQIIESKPNQKELDDIDLTPMTLDVSIYYRNDRIMPSKNIWTKNLPSIKKWKTTPDGFPCYSSKISFFELNQIVSELEALSNRLLKNKSFL